MSAVGHGATSELAPIPAHVSPERVFDIDIYHPPGAEDDYHLSLKKVFPTFSGRRATAGTGSQRAATTSTRS
jgi:hypothetical protein